MRLQTKILALLSVTVGIILISFFAFHYIRMNEKQVLYSENKKNQEAIIDKVLEINRLKYEILINDNSGWDDMVSFVEKPDSLWAKDNVDFFVNTFNLSFVLTYNKKKELTYQFGDTTCLHSIKYPNKPLIDSTLDKSPFLHYFQYCGNDLVEIFGAIVVPASDADLRITPPNGYLFIGRKWDIEYLNEHAEATGFEAAFMNENELADFKNKPSNIHIFKPLYSYDGKVISTLVFSTKDPLMQEMSFFRFMSVLISVITVMSILVFLLLFNKIFLKPLSNVKSALNSHSTKPIEQFRQMNDEYKVLGELIENFFNQQEILRIKNKELHDTNATKDKLFSIIAHDLKNPVGSIVTLTEIMPDFIKNKDLEAANEISELIGLQAKESMSLLETLFDWAKSQTGAINYNPDFVSLNHIVENVVKSVSTSASMKNILISNSVISEIKVFADKHMLSSVFRNLLTNAIKFTHSGGNIGISAFADEKNIEVIVTDNGVGMDEKTIGQLFKIDSNLTNYGTANEKGTGLGLIICKEFIEKHGGKITVSSHPGKGSRFSIILPVHSNNL